ncbi:glycosyltransferase family 1 protein [Bradyrhizobium prioriisuperbiae]|uniref:glycosyltransferase family 4 protein n=1 Tax=Bradyrhizobium prioriisuperbiae TaxID=2854389 RepID=UPI0028E86B76|nr:glycosyltransferase family 1 protein [Bradyrhizobium prioritasuperba]
MKNILVVSESLGEPNHKRGIFHFTRELVRSLQADGHRLTLVVETTRRYRKLKRQQDRVRLFPPGSRLVELLALYRFLDENDMSERGVLSPLRQSIDWVMRRARAAASLDLAMSVLRSIGLFRRPVRLIENSAGGFDYVPADLRHLELFKAFQLESGIYSHQGLSSVANLPPPQVDGRNYDVVLIDAPTRVTIRRGPNTKVVCVVHDLLPVTDLKLSDVATRIYMLRLITSLRQADELRFVSRYTRDRFAELLPQFAHLPSRVVYPRTRFEVPRPRSVAGRNEPVRPSFVVIVSAEHRKNLHGVIQAFKSLPNADLFVIGYTGGTKVTHQLPPNVRYTGYLDEREKAALIADAYGVIMPSFAEGFGVPIIEALAANTPVLCSDIAVFREVAGDLADYFDPFSTRSICESVGRVITRQQEWREKIVAQRTTLMKRYGHQTQGRDFLASCDRTHQLIFATQ